LTSQEAGQRARPGAAGESVRAINELLRGNANEAVGMTMIESDMP
jgi:hypothetical protein